MFKLNMLRKELDFNKNIGDIISVLKGVASSEFYRIKKSKKGLDEFLDYLHGFFRMIDISGMQHLFLEDSSLPHALLLITSDIGFLGKLNIAVVNTALEQSSEKDELIIVGKQGARYIDETSRNLTSFAGISDEVKYEEAEGLADFILKGIFSKKFCRTSIIYPHFISFAVWKIQVYQLFPCSFLFQASSKAKKKEAEDKIIIEPTLVKVIEYLVRIWIRYILYGIFWESKLSEWATRVIHLEGSSYEIKQMNKKLRSQYFRILHEISDKNIREIFVARQAMEKVTQFS